MRVVSLASIKNITTMCNMRHTIPTHHFPPTRLRSPSFHRLCPPSHTPRHLLRAYIPPLPPLHLHWTSMRFLKRSSTLSRSPLRFSTISSISRAVNSSVRRQPSIPTRPPPRDMTEASVYHDMPALIHSNFRRASLSHIRSANH